MYQNQNLCYFMCPKNIFQSSFNINGFIMEYVTEFNFLGLILDSTGTGRHITILLMSK